MSTIISIISPYLGYLAPPIIGAFIGYFTNRVAIRMLFRPLCEWRIFGVRVPMTPGVIPSKRHELAINIGEMVGEHLLTSKEIGKALKKENFQNHLHGLIKNRISGVLERDLGSLSTIIPRKFRIYYDIGIKTITYHVKSNIHNYIRSDEFERRVRSSVDSSYQLFLHNNIDFVMNKESRESSYNILEKSLKRMLSSQAMEQWVHDFVYRRLRDILEKNKNLDDLLPESLKELLRQMVGAQTPELLKKIAEILKDPEIQDKIVSGIKKGVDNFIGSLGPMSAMARGFLSMETVERKVKEYLKENENGIVDWLQNQEVQEKITITTLERLNSILRTPIVDFTAKDNPIDVESFSNKIALYLCAFLREKSTSETLFAMIKDNIEIYLEGGSVELRTILEDLFGIESGDKIKSWLGGESLSLLRAQRTRKTIDEMIESMISSLLLKPIGKLSNMLPAGVREGMYNSVHKLAMAMLAGEVPGLVSSFNVRNIVTEKVNSLDLLRLEGLLLSIMEEQFKYINLFGALLGFIIGCLNLLLISVS